MKFTSRFTKQTTINTKRTTMRILLITIILSLSITSHANDLGKIIDELTVPLSSPDKRGKLYVKQVYGSLSVTGYSGKEVQITIRQKQNQYKIHKKNGLTRISNNSFNLEVEEDDNLVIVKSMPHGRATPINLDIKIPYNFDLKLRSVNNGNTVVKGINGEMEVSNVNGSITLESISGTASADSSNGFIHVTFNRIDNNTNMAFSSINQDVDISLPKNVKANIKAKTVGGEILTGFDMVMDKNAVEVDKKHANGKYKLGFQQWVKGKINGGGTEFIMSTVNSDIIIRKLEKPQAPKPPPKL